MEEKIGISRFLDADGKIVQLSNKGKYKITILRYLAEKFEENLNYTEKEVNEICNKWHTFRDYFMLRRELLDNELLCRLPDGSRYWRLKKD